MLTTITQNLKHTKPLFILILSLLTIFTFMGCKSPEATDIPSEPISEVVSEEVSEVVSEEPLEEVSEPASEEVVEEEMDLTPYTTANGKTIVDLLDDMEYTELKVIIWRNGEGAKAILSSGDSYILEEEDAYLTLYYPNEMQNIEFNVDYIEKVYEDEISCDIMVYGTGENIKVPITATDVDGNQYEITIYIDKDWKYDWEE